MTPDEIRRRAAELTWYHTVDLGHGIMTPGTYDLRPLLAHYGIPDSLAGKSVLDVGPGHGFFSFEFEQRGAARVATAELPAWGHHDASPVLRAEFDRTQVNQTADAYLHGALGLAIEARGSRIERFFCNVYDLSPENVGAFDLVFCASVLLHLSDPLRAMYGIRRVTRDQAIICTGIDNALHVRHQARARFRGTATGQVFWFPTMRCLEQMALAAGFRRVERVSTFRLKSTDGAFNTPHGTIRAVV
jgi:tRNA (mo5U34)-methyltransferase